MRKLKSPVSVKWLKEKLMADGSWQQRKHYVDANRVWHEVRNGTDTMFPQASVMLHQSIWTLWFEETQQWVDTMENIYGYNSSGTSLIVHKEKEDFTDGSKWRYSEVAMMEKGKKPKVRIIGTYTNGDGTRNADKCIYAVVELPAEPMNGGI